MSAVVLKHAFVSAKSDGPDTTLVRPSNWNAGIKVTGGADGQKFIRDSAATDGASFVDPETINFTNNSGGSVAAGDVLAVGSGGAVADDVSGALQKFIVALATIANAATGPWAKSGYVSTVKAQGAISALHYVRKSATAKAVEDTGTAVADGTPCPLGAIGISTAAASGGFVAMLLFDSTQGGPPVTAGYIKGTGSGYTTQSTPLPVADLGSGTPAAGKYVDGGTGAWTTLPTSVLDKTGVAVTVGNTTTETALYSKSIAGNTIGANGKLRLTMIGSYTWDTGIARNIVFRFKYGATTLVSHTLTLAPDATGTGTTRSGDIRIVFEIANKNATNSQAGIAVIEAAVDRLETQVATVTAQGFTGAAGTFNGNYRNHQRGTSAIDSTAAQTLAATMQWNGANVAATLTMDHFTLELL